MRRRLLLRALLAAPLLLGTPGCATTDTTEARPGDMPAVDGDWAGHYVVPGDLPQSVSLVLRTQGSTVTGRMLLPHDHGPIVPRHVTGQILAGSLRLTDGQGLEMTLTGGGDVLQGEVLVLGSRLPRRGTVTLTRMRR
ncbi:MAG TPA: hypothetical protein VNN07_10315 [Candidatus Tectomicrobia bacterium]|nr:hypothetical protein [Candidatus Tectomicrobia bacterium]